MARPQYPSDLERRKVRPHVKIHLTVNSHRRTAAVWANPTLRGMLTELWRIGAEVFAGQTGGVVQLSPSAVRAITGCAHPAYARRRLQALCDALGYPCHFSGTSRGLLGQFSVEVCTVQVRNFVKKQGFTPRLAEHSAASDSESGSGSGSPPANDSPAAAAYRACARDDYSDAYAEAMASLDHDLRGAGAHVACAGDSPEAERTEPQTDSATPRSAESGAELDSATPRSAESPERHSAAPRSAESRTEPPRADEPRTEPPQAAPGRKPPHRVESTRERPEPIRPAPRGPRWPHLELGDMVRAAPLRKAYEYAAAQGWVPRGDAGKLEVVAAAQAALTSGDVNPPGLFLTMLRLPVAERGIDAKDERAASALFRRWYAEQAERALAESGASLGS